jgi:predicted  nucleic acid-binding Zn-ribbon protein
VAFVCAEARAQTPERRPNAPATQEQTPDAGAADTLASEVALLRKSLQTLNTRLREISEMLVGAEAAKPAAAPDGRQGRLAQNLALLSTAEQRAEMLRSQLVAMTERETGLRNRLVELDEDMRPDSIDRSLSLVGTTRTPELRDERRRMLENERKGVESLLGQASQSRARLEDDVRQADSMVARLRQRLLPLIDREIDAINPNPD